MGRYCNRLTHPHCTAPLQVARPEGNNTFIPAVLQAVEDQGKQLDECGVHEAPTPLHRAVACNQPGVLRSLLAKGHSPEAAALRSGLTPLTLAAVFGLDNCIRELLAASADPNAADGAGDTAAFYAAEADDWHGLRRLLSGGASTDTACEISRTPLHVAAEQGEEAWVWLGACGGMRLRLLQGALRVYAARLSLSACGS